jgi:hypothetical protein
MTWSALGVSVAGTSHHARDVPCQDCNRYALFGPAGDWLVVAVADGAGSASRAEVGAALVCEQLVGRILDLKPDGPLDEDAARCLFAEVRAALLDEAERLSVPPRELACTAILAVIGPGTAAFAQLGDGAIVVGGEGYRRVVFWPQPEEYANATDFLTDPRFDRALRFEAATEEVSELCVFTDGLQRLALDFANETTHTPFFDPLFARVRDAANAADLQAPLREFLTSPRVNERTDDDKTLVLATRRA